MSNANNDEYEETETDESVQELTPTQLFLRNEELEGRNYEIDTIPFPQYTGNWVLELNPSAGIFKPINVHGNHKGTFEKNGRNKTVLIPDNGGPKKIMWDLKPMMGKGKWFEFKFKFFLIVSKIFGFKVFHQVMFNLYGIQSTGEYTIDLYSDETPDDLRVKMEDQLKINAEIMKVDIIGYMRAGMRTLKTWTEYIPYIILLLVIFLFLFFMGQYSLIKE